MLYIFYMYICMEYSSEILFSPIFTPHSFLFATTEWKDENIESGSFIFFLCRFVARHAIHKSAAQRKLSCANCSKWWYRNFSIFILLHSSHFDSSMTSRCLYSFLFSFFFSFSFSHFLFLSLYLSYSIFLTFILLSLVLMHAIMIFRNELKSVLSVRYNAKSGETLATVQLFHSFILFHHIIESKKFSYIFCCWN